VLTTIKWMGVTAAYFTIVGYSHSHPDLFVTVNLFTVQVVATDLWGAATRVFAIERFIMLEVECSN
jgi:hypothetical protein